MRILHLISDTDRRGAQVFASDLATALDRRGHTNRLIALQPGNNGGVSAEVIGGGRLDPTALRRVRAAMSDADVAIAHGSTTLLAASIAGIGTGTPFIARQISDPRFWARTPVQRLRVSSYYLRARHAVALAPQFQQTLTHWLFVPAHKVTVIPNGVSSEHLTPGDRADARTRLGLPVDRPIVAIVGALSHEKAIDRAVRAAVAVDAHLIVGGDGPLRAELTALANRVHPGGVTWLGQVADPAPVYQAADVVLLTSRSEAMPGTVIEAGLCARPVIATDVGAVRDVIVPSVTGVIVSTDDDAAFTAALADLLADPDRCRSMGDAARDHCVARFSIDVVAASWEQVLTAAAGR